MDTVKAHRKCLGRHFHRDVNGHKYSTFIMVVFVPCGFVPIWRQAIHLLQSS
jgi:hypothetical protein